jgi:hypothetical protein
LQHGGHLLGSVNGIGTGYEAARRLFLVRDGEQCLGQLGWATGLLIVQ